MARWKTSFIINKASAAVSRHFATLHDFASDLLPDKPPASPGLHFSLFFLFRPVPDPVGIVRYFRLPIDLLRQVKKLFFSACWTSRNLFTKTLFDML